MLSLLLQVIALVMDAFTDIDIFSDLQDAFNNRKVPVYILLDQDSLPHFLEMCDNLGVCPEQESVSTDWGCLGLVWLYFLCYSLWLWTSKLHFCKPADFLGRLQHPVCLVTDVKGDFLTCFSTSEDQGSISHGFSL